MEETGKKDHKILKGLAILCLDIAIAAAIDAVVIFVVIPNFIQIGDFEPKINYIIPEEERKLLPGEVNVQSTIDSWANSSGGAKAAIVYDLDRDEVIGQYNPDQYFNMASLYKLFVIYEGYQRITNGEWKADDAAGSTGHTILECLDLSVRESNSACAETLWNKIGRNELTNIMRDKYDILRTVVSSIASTPSDITKILKLIYEHKNIKDETLLARMKDSFLNQPATEYDWRQGLPAGFSNETKVYNKSGWNYDPDQKQWTCYNDAAIIETKSGRHFIVVLMTSGLSFTKNSELGSVLEAELP